MGPRIILLLSVLALMLIGFVMIYSTSAVITLAKAGTEVAVDPMAETLNQIKFAVAGVILAFDHLEVRSRLALAQQCGMGYLGRGVRAARDHGGGGRGR